MKEPDLGHWKPLPYGRGRPSASDAQLAGMFDTNLAPVREAFFAVSDRTEEDFDGDVAGIVAAMDQDAAMLAPIEDKTKWNVKALRKAGLARPRLWVSADRTSSGSLVFKVVPYEADWLSFPIFAKPPGGRRRNEMAFIRNVGDLFVGGHGSLRVDATPLEVLVRNDMAVLVLRAWANCLASVAEHFGVEIDQALEPAMEKAAGSRIAAVAGLRLLDEDARRRIETPAKKAATRTRSLT